MSEERPAQVAFGILLMILMLIFLPPAMLILRLWRGVFEFRRMVAEPAQLVFEDNKSYLPADTA